MNSEWGVLSFSPYDYLFRLLIYAESIRYAVIQTETYFMLSVISIFTIIIDHTLSWVGKSHTKDLGRKINFVCKWPIADIQITYCKRQ